MSVFPLRRVAAQAPIIVFLAGSAVILAVGGFALSSLLHELPRSKAATRGEDVLVYVEVLGAAWLAVTALAIGGWVWFTRRNAAVRGRRATCSTRRGSSSRACSTPSRR